MLPPWMFMKMILLMMVMIVPIVTVQKRMKLSIKEKIPTVINQWRKRVSYTRPLVVGKEREG